LVAEKQVSFAIEEKGFLVAVAVVGLIDLIAILGRVLGLL